jgi:hypothetical protein
MFLPNGGGKQGLGIIQPDGTYKLGTYSSSDGALVGTHHAMVIRIAPTSESADLLSFRRTEDANISVEANRLNEVNIDLSSKEWQSLSD